MRSDAKTTYTKNYGFSKIHRPFQEITAYERTVFKDSVKALHTCSHFFRYLKTYAF